VSYPTDTDLAEIGSKSLTMSVGHEGQYIYCIIETDEARNFGSIGIGERNDSVTTISYKDLSAVVSSVPMAKYVVSRRTILAHEKVIEKVMEGYSVLPVRFYTVAPNAEEIRNLLRKRYSEFKRLLREMDNKVELGLKCLWKDMDTILNEIVDGSKNRRAPDQIIKLALQDRKVRESEPIIQRLRKISSDLCLNKIYGDDMLINAAFLVDRYREKEFDSEVAQLATQFEKRIEFKYIGPVPPYSFVNIVVEP